MKHNTSFQTGDVSPIGELDPHVATLQGSTTELLQFTVLGIIDKVMLVLHKTTNETYIMKVRVNFGKSDC